MVSIPALVRRKTMLGDHPTMSAQTMDELYLAGDVIGTGSFGIIRKVTRRADGAVLARKELNYGRMDERDIRQLTEEVNILEGLPGHEHIVRYIERFVDKPNSMLYILMEFCEGGDLSGLIQRERKVGRHLSEDVVWLYLTQLTLALGLCHSDLDDDRQKKHVVLHRDLKPDNVFLDRDNNLKLGDFGLSKAMEQAAMTQTYVGTPYYMSPELINGHLYDVKSDIWALGCLVFEMCAGHPPFHEARTQPELAELVRAGKIPELPDCYSKHLGQVVNAMLRQEPRKRPNTQQLMGLDKVKEQKNKMDYSKRIKTALEDIRKREAIVLQRENAVLERERNLLLKEHAFKQQIELLREAQARLQQQEMIAAARQLQQVSMSPSGNLDGRENQRPAPGSTSPNLDGDELIARVASRPSALPRRPLADERRSSNSGLPGITIPRVSSTSSLMSLDGTPMKLAPQSIQRKLAAKSMVNLHTAYKDSSLATPGRAQSVHRTAMGRTHSCDSPGGMNRPRGSDASMAILDQEGPDSPSLLAKPSAAIVASPKPAARHAPASAVPSYLDEADMPSPFLKKIDGAKFPVVPTRTTASTGSAAGAGRPAPTMARKPSRVSLASKPQSVTDKLIQAREQAKQSAEEVARRVSAAARPRRASMQAGTAC